jgi:glycosyltransferase involved in cell wall biosynthesis
MDLVVALDFRFQATPDGSVWTSTAFAHSFWTRYLDVFDRVRIVARAASLHAPQPGDHRVDGEGVSVCQVPFYLGPAQYLRKALAVRRAALGGIGERDAVILRVGSELASSIAPAMMRQGRPYGLEVVGDPYDAFAPGAICHPLRPFFRWRNTRLLKRQCAGACGAAYVTESALQNRYACPAHMTAVSDVELPEEFWDALPRPRHAFDERRLIFVGSLEQMYKGPDVLIDAMALCLREDPSLLLVMIGEGRHLPELEERARALGIADRVRFMGKVPAGAAVRDELDRSSLFILPSRTEGLPRAMLEAMARGLPAIGTAVGGIPELLAPEDLVPPNDVPALASRILEVTRDPRRIERMSERNRRKARQYREEILRPRRLAFYRHVAESTGAWLDRTGQASRREGEHACTACRENV